MLSNIKKNRDIKYLGKSRKVVLANYFTTGDPLLSFSSWQLHKSDRREVSR